MKNLQSVIDDLEAVKKEQRKLRKECRDAIVNDIDCTAAKVKYRDATALKELAEIKVKGQMTKAYLTLEELKQERKGLEQMVSDIAITNLMAGNAERIEIKGQLMLPIYKVNFKKS